MGLKHNEVHFKMTYEGHSNCSKTNFIYEHFVGLWVLSRDLKIDFMMFEPHQVPFYKHYP